MSNSAAPQRRPTAGQETEVQSVSLCGSKGMQDGRIKTERTGFKEVREETLGGVRGEKQRSQEKDKR